MKVKERVLILTFGFILLVAGLGVVYRLAVDQATWRPSDIYNEVGGSYYSSVSSSSSASDGVAVSMRSGMRSSRRRVKMPVFSNARSAEGLSAIAVANSQSPIANSQGLYTTSSHMAKSFGSGFATGTAAPSFVTRNSEQPATSTLPMLSVDASQLANASAVYANNYTPMSSVVSAVGAGNAPTVKAAPSRRRAPGTVSGTWDTWLNGLDVGNGYLYADDEGNRYYDMEALRAYFEANKDHFPGWTWEDFLAQFFNQQDKHRVPLGEPWLLLILALAYVGYVFVRRIRICEI